MPHLHIFTIFTFLLLAAAATTNHRQRRLLHQPLLPLDQTLPPGATTISQSPLSSPSLKTQPQQPEYPFSTLPPPAAPTAPENPFFPNILSTPPSPPPPSSATAFATFPANISSLVLPSSHSSHKPTKLISLIVAVSLFSVLVFTSIVLLFLRYRHLQYHYQDKTFKSDSLRLFPPNTTPSDTSATTIDASKKPPSQLFPPHAPSSTSSEFLYLGTLVSSRDPENYAASSAGQYDVKAPPSAAVPMNNQRLGSPELQPLPPLPRPHSGQIYHNPNLAEGEEGNNNEIDGKEMFFSPRGSTANNTSPFRTRSSSRQNNSGNGFNQTGNPNSFGCSSPVYSISPDNSPSVLLSSDSPQSLLTKSPDSLVIFPAPLPRFIPPPPARQPRAFSVLSPSSTDDFATRDCSPRVSDFSSVGKVTPLTPPPPPLHAPRVWAAEPPTGPPELVAPARKVVFRNLSGEMGTSGNSRSKSEEMMNPKLRPLHWNKMRGSSDGAVAWDKLKSSSFQLNEEMSELPFEANSSTMKAKDGVRRQMLPEKNEENLVIDPRKSQNIDILLRALNVTMDEVCEALLEGNADTLGSELLESLLKMAPTVEEERRLKELQHESPLELGPAESFLKVVLSIPFALKRVDAMLYLAHFESEVEHLNRSFDTIELACKELKSSLMFMKLLEAVLEAGNLMNTSTNRGDAQTFKLNTLLKLADLKVANGRTTLLHFVVQEIIRAEGARSSKPALQNERSQQPTLWDEVKLKKLGLQAVSGLSGELTNVKKAAAIDSHALSKDVEKLSAGIRTVREAIEICGGRFSENMSDFLRKAEVEIGNVRAQEGVAFSMVKGLTEYFHGDSGRVEVVVVPPQRLFMTVRDFLAILDSVCKDVGRMNERAMVNTGPQSQANAGPNGIVFRGCSEGHRTTSACEDAC